VEKELLDHNWTKFAGFFPKKEHTGESHLEVQLINFHRKICGCQI